MLASDTHIWKKYNTALLTDYFICDVCKLIVFKFNNKLETSGKNGFKKSSKHILTCNEMIIKSIIE